MTSRLTPAELEAVFTRTWAETKSPLAVAEAIQCAVLSRVEDSRRAPRRRWEGWSPEKDPRVDAIIEAVAAMRGVPVEELKGRRRWRLVTRARHEAAWLIRQSFVDPVLAYEVIGEALGGQDHATIINGCQNIQALVDETPSYGDRLRALVAHIFADDARRAA